VELKSTAFLASDFLRNTERGNHIIQFSAKDTLFTQGTEADSVFYLDGGLARLSTVSETGNEVTIMRLSAGDFVGEECLLGSAGIRLATATAITPCTAIKIERDEMIRMMHEEQSFSDFFVAYLLARGIRTRTDLVDQLLNSSERRLAGVLSLLAHLGPQG
jgi:CRP/FNR family transcriptional regulator, cyclic AMP receptor protein